MFFVRIRDGLRATKEEITDLQGETTNIEYERRPRGNPYHPSRVKKDLQILESL